MAEAIEAELTWTGERFERGVRVEVADDGRIASVGRAGGGGCRSLSGRALLPGFVSAHSHAFQRGLRGVGEVFPAGSGSFWSWRAGMYGLVEGLDGPGLRALAARAFREMRAAGITSVGEFHYLHHAGSGLDFALDGELLAAASDVGIRLVLLEAYYATGGPGRVLEGAQRRFATPDPAEYWAQMDRLSESLDPSTQSLGAVVHSVRAAPPEVLAEVHAEAVRRGLVFHMHLEEQPREIEECRGVYGMRPLELVLRHVDVDERFTGVHLTHARSEDVEAFVAAGGGVCLCPLTEANLGDGVPDVPALLAEGASVCLGTDSNSRLCMLEEARWLEYVQRLTRQRRGVCLDERGDPARWLLDAATRNGARALGLQAGRIAAGCLADFVSIDLEAPALADLEDEALLAGLVFGAGNDVVAGTCVGGHWTGG